jgi:hypothetical protein
MKEGKLKIFVAAIRKCYGGEAIGHRQQVTGKPSNHKGTPRKAIGYWREQVT